MTVHERVRTYFESFGGRIDFDTAEQASTVGLLPEAVAECFTGIDKGQIDDFAFACCIFGRAIVRCDDMMDYAVSDPKILRYLPHVLALLSEAYRVFGSLFARDDVFWRHMQRYLLEFIDAMNEEAKYSGKGADWRPLTEDGCRELLRRKCGLVRIIAAGACALACDFSRLDILENTLLRYFVSYQMLDDLQDWREDVRDGNVSLLLRSCCDAPPSIDDMDLLGKRIYLEGHAVKVLEVSEREAAIGLEQAMAVGCGALADLFRRRADQVSALRSNLEEGIEEQIRLARVKAGIFAASI